MYKRQVNYKELEKRRNYAERNDFQNDYRELFRGLVYCADCHSLMSAGKGCARMGANTPSRIFYDCNTYRYSEHIQCTSHYVRQERIYSVVKNAIDQQMKVAVDVEQLIADIKNSVAVKFECAELTEPSASISAKRKGLEDRMERLLVDLTARIIDRNEYEYMRAKYLQQLKDLQNVEENINVHKSAVQEKLSDVQAWLRNMKEYQSLPDLTPEILRLLVKKILVHDSRDISIVFNFSDPYKIIADVRNCAEEVLQVG